MKKESIHLFFILFIFVCGTKTTNAQELSKKIPWISAYKKYQFSKLKIESNSYLFTVKYNNDFVADYTGQIKYSKEKKSYYLASKEGDIFPSQTKYIYRIVDKDTVIGYTWNNCWLFRNDSGEISSYAVLAGNSDIYVKYLSKKGDPKYYLFDEDFIDTGLVNLIKDDIDAVEYLKKSKRKLHFRMYGSLELLGAALLIIGAAKDESPLEIATSISIPALLAIPFLVHPPSPLEIIRYYNTNKILQKEIGQEN